MNYFIGVDLGGTTVKTGIVNENFQICGRAVRPTHLPKSAEQIADLIAESVFSALEAAGKTIADAQWVGVGIPGVIDAKNGIINFASNFDFNTVPMAALLEKRLNIPIFIENDANAAILGEMLDGSARGCKNVVMLTLGTGVGGGVIINGEIYSGFNNQGAELGHVGIMYGGEPCLCGHTGCIEVYCSATSLIRQTIAAMEKNPDSIMWALAENDTNNVTGRTAFDGKNKGDKSALAVVEQYTDYLSYAVVNYINIFQPEIIVIGGGISSQGDAMLTPIRQYAAKHSLGYTKESHTKIELVKLGNDAGIIGAGFLGRNH